MKLRLLVLVVLTFLVGCADYIDRNEYEHAVRLCESFGGLRNVKVISRAVRHVSKVQAGCADGSYVIKDVEVIRQ